MRLTRASSPASEVVQDSSQTPQSVAMLPLSRRKLEALKKGEKVGITLIKANQPDEFLTTISKEVAKHFSATWRLDIANGAKTLRVNAYKDCIKFVLEWMWSGGADPVRDNAVPYPADHLGNLRLLNALATRLGIQLLVDRTAADIARIGGQTEAINIQKEKKAAKEAYLARAAARAERGAKRIQRQAERAQREAERAQREADYLASAECFSCHQTGHLARNCPTPRPPPKCSHCGVKGVHKSDECPKFGQATGSEVKPQKAPATTKTKKTRAKKAPQAERPPVTPVTSDKAADTRGPVETWPRKAQPATIDVSGPLPPSKSGNQKGFLATDGAAEAPAGVTTESATKAAAAQKPPKKRLQKKAQVVQAIPNPVGELTSTGAPIWVKDAHGTEFPLYWSQIRIMPDPDAGGLGYRINGTVLVGPAK